MSFLSGKLCLSSAFGGVGVLLDGGDLLRGEILFVADVLLTGETEFSGEILRKGEDFLGDGTLLGGVFFDGVFLGGELFFKTGRFEIDFVLEYEASFSDDKFRLNGFRTSLK